MKNAFPAHLICKSTTLLIMVLHLLLLLSPPPPASGSDQPQPPLTARDNALFEEKTRLGSTPPSCYNKCNQCHPCMAVQVPSSSISSLNRVGPELTPATKMVSFYPSSQDNRYSDYKPVGWKCRCRNHFFNP